MATILPAAPAAAFALHDAEHWRFAEAFAPALEAIEQRVDLLSRFVGAQARAVMARAGLAQCDYFLCSTLPTGPADIAVLLDGIGRRCGQRPLGLMHTYECAGWGYVLRFAARVLGASRLMISIVDADLYRLRFWGQQPGVGAAGYGITTLLLTLVPGNGSAVDTGGPFPNSAFKELIRAIRERHQHLGPVQTFLPFFTGTLGQIAERLLDRRSLAENYHDRYGHCFGSDAWIGIIEWLRAQPATVRQSVIASTIAYGGYYAVANVALSPDTHVALQALRGEACGSAEAAAYTAGGCA